jgi:hypothetical protein
MGLGSAGDEYRRRPFLGGNDGFLGGNDGFLGGNDGWLG